MRLSQAKKGAFEGENSVLGDRFDKDIFQHLTAVFNGLQGVAQACIFRSIANRIPFDREQRSDSSRTAFRLIANTIPEHPEQDKPTY